MIQAIGTRRTRNDNISVACMDCPKCGKENVVARVSSARSGFNSSARSATSLVSDAESYLRLKNRNSQFDGIHVSKLIWNTGLMLLRGSTESVSFNTSARCA
jgi:hypothetical protein